MRTGSGPRHPPARRTHTRGAHGQRVKTLRKPRDSELTYTPMKAVEAFGQRLNSLFPEQIHQSTDRRGPQRPPRGPILPTPRVHKPMVPVRTFGSLGQLTRKRRRGSRVATAWLSRSDGVALA